MKKIYFLVFMVSFPIMGISQQLNQTRINHHLSMLLPDDIEKIDTLGAITYGGTLNKGFISAVLFNDSRGKINNGKEIETFLKGFQKGMVETAKGTIISQTFIELKSVKVNKVLMLSDFIPNMVQWNTYTFRIDSTTYTIQFVYPKQMEETPEEDLIIKSLEFSTQ
ncbi:hypothetical protein NAT51_14965 [Flavobacterium amniphilum]|uniref:hypothetical protein n=1 Tax=Flavobacterium amniphilum TaxID=1834035 RepID=UPI00202A6CBC|nr:hypothetical protein [Flavobacterium amniphilum]MCL9806834.1 hypothetical protein [Flavobacterium amniphilum]